MSYLPKPAARTSMQMSRKISANKFIGNQETMIFLPLLRLNFMAIHTAWKMLRHGATTVKSQESLVTIASQDHAMLGRQEHQHLVLSRYARESNACLSIVLKKWSSTLDCVALTCS